MALIFKYLFSVVFYFDPPPFSPSSLLSFPPPSPLKWDLIVQSVQTSFDLAIFLLQPAECLKNK